ncbi:hypothetical protein H632_c3364p0 [Helicosporidium sp. ATCC 50920]|nr:hypothetical protein H632_c3364p0 [Helicosporidium sp. ATCC 50920]|eukprot:KDD72424.1 hypothetical protein H632_c3364p0 [Helicosporidium sp. ATCC 50920]
MLSRIISRATRAFRNRDVVGVDGLGNVYYREMEKSMNGETVEKRRVDMQGREYSPDLIPPEWSQWLSRTRHDPPLAEEIAA